MTRKIGNGQYGDDELSIKSMNANAGMRLFDAQPAWVKEMLWYSSINLGLDAVAGPGDRAVLTADLAKHEESYTLSLWGAAFPAMPAALPPRRPGAATLRATRRDPCARRLKP